MKISKDARRLSRGLFTASFTEGRLDQEKVRMISARVVEKRPRHTLSVLKEYQRLLRLEIEKHRAVVESATELDPTVREELEKTLTAKYGPDLRAEFRVTPSLIGGLRLRVGSDVFDSSVRDRLSRLEDQFARG